MCCLSPFSPGTVLYNAGSAASFEQNVNETGRDLEWRETEDVLQDLQIKDCVSVYDLSKNCSCVFLVQRVWNFVSCKVFVNKNAFWSC